MTEDVITVEEFKFLCTRAAPQEAEKQGYEMDSTTFEKTDLEMRMPIVTDKAEVFYTGQYIEDSLDVRMYGECPLCNGGHIIVAEPEEVAEKTEVSLEDAKSLMPE
jgi:hypothetical protein